VLDCLACEIKVKPLPAWKRFLAGNSNDKVVGLDGYSLKDEVVEAQAGKGELMRQHCQSYLLRDLVDAEAVAFLLKTEFELAVIGHGWVELAAFAEHVLGLALLLIYDDGTIDY
jgi:hypothetical protein